jgi:hypothetical protein
MLRKSILAFTVLGVATWLLTVNERPAQGAGLGAPLPVRVVREYIEDDQQARYADLLAEFGRNKDLPEGYELQTLLALSHYPELQDTRIRFVVDDVNIPLSSRPHWASMHRSAGKRTYLVVIDSQREGSRRELLLEYQPFNAQTGIIGHELAHTVYYLDRSFFGILGDALCQLSRCRIGFERETDKRTVDYGLGWQRYDHSVFLRSSFGMDPDAEPNPGSAYMGPRELLTLMAANPAYQSTLAQL